MADKSPETLAAANGIASDSAFGAVAPPLYLSSTFAFRGLEQPGPFDYSRTANPTRSLLADTLAKLEGGAGAVITASAWRRWTWSCPASSPATGWSRRMIAMPARHA
jgi:cystathionine beta-lyase/cystathionine gamma-synthase